MEVTQTNFEAACAELVELLPTADFIAIDEEMTGIILSGQHHTQGDTPEARYRKMRMVAMEFNVMQVGVCLFHSTGEGFVARPYNFFVFPDVKSSRARLTMHASTADFHKQNGFDFNKWIREGVPFLSEAECTRETAAMTEERPQPEPKTASQRVLLTREDDQKFVREALADVAAWVD